MKEFFGWMAFYNQRDIDSETVTVTDNVPANAPPKYDPEKGTVMKGFGLG